MGKKTEVGSGKRPGMPSDLAERLKALEHENREPRQANEILRKAQCLTVTPYVSLPPSNFAFSG